MTEIGKVDPAAWGIYETREIIQMFGLKGDKAARMRTHLKGCTLLMVLNFRDSLLGHTAGLFGGHSGHAPPEEGGED
jgi:hypothetical protein